MDQFLSQMIAKVEEQRILIENECSTLSELLKPWPQNNSHSREATCDQEERDTNASLSANEKKLEDMSQADLEALEQVNQILCKAKWTRESKLKKLNKDDSTFSSLLDKPIPGEKVSIDAVTVPNERHDDHICSTNITNDLGQKRPPQRGKKPTVQSHTIKENSFDKSKPVSKSIRKPSSRPSSVLSSRSSSRRSDYVPAHVNAPFKTDVNARVPNRKFNHLKKNQIATKIKENLTHFPKAQSHSLEATAFKTLPGIKTQMNISERKNYSEKADEPIVTFPEKDCLKVVETVSQVPESDKNPTESFNDNGPKEMVSEEKHCLGVGETDLKISSEGRTTYLKNQSCNLKIPSKLKRLYSSNITLLKQCHDAKICKKVSNMDPGQAFIQRLQSQTEVSEELWIRDRALICLRAHNIMLQTVQSLQLGTFTEKSSYEMMYKAKKKLEFILCMFEKLQDEAEYFSQVQLRTLASITLESDLSESPVFKELETVQQNETEILCESECRLVHKELESSNRWMHLRFMKFYYQLQLHLLSLAEREWGYLLSSNPRDLACLQLVHGLITTNGEHLPAIVGNSFS